MPAEIISGGHTISELDPKPTLDYFFSILSKLSIALIFSMQVQAGGFAIVASHLYLYLKL